MKRDWTPDSLTEYFTLSANELEMIGINDAHNQLGKALLLKWFPLEGRFPSDPTELPEAVIAYVATQLRVPVQAFQHYKWQGRSIKQHRHEVRSWYGFRRITRLDQGQLVEWLMSEVLPEEDRLAMLEDHLYQRLRSLSIEPASVKQIKRLATSALFRYEERFFQQTYQRLSSEVQTRLRHLIELPGSDADVLEDEAQSVTPLYQLKSEAGAARVNDIRQACTRLKQIQSLGLPSDLFQHLPLRWLRRYQQQVSIASPSHLLRRERDDPAQTYTLLAAFCWVRQREITDDVVDLVLRVLKDIQIRAEHREEKRVLRDFIRVGGKQQLLFRLVEAMHRHPQGVIGEVLYPIIGNERMQALLDEAQHTGPYRRAVQSRISRSYLYHYRQILPPLLEVLTFRSNNDSHQPLLAALELVGRYLNYPQPVYPADVVVPVEHVIQTQWLGWIMQRSRGGLRQIHRGRYELCVLQSLRDQLRCKEIWVEGADRYRNPDEDVPIDFPDKRVEYYGALDLPLKADVFIAQLKTQLHEALQQLNDGLPQNPAVKILPKAGGWIRLSPAPRQAEPDTLRALKQAVKQRWGLTSLLDVVKEVDLRVGFSANFESLSDQQRLPQDDLQKRLLLCVFGLGTNTGLSRVSLGPHGIPYSQLQYVSRRYLSPAPLRQAIRQVVDATLAVKQAHIWGETATWCASDSKQFGAWSQNLRAQWHNRYRQAGVMVYWHVAKQATCIYSQLKAPSSSEAASMIEGVLRHCTQMHVQRNYVDTHGQSEVAFAFCRLLGFQLMPRLKRLHEQKLALPDKAAFDRYPHLALILKSAIDWDVISQQYDEMVKYATALRLGTAETEAILKRFTRQDVQHPTYKALSELGRALKTIFLCQYLRDATLRQEIEEGLNVIENWNSANGFIFYGRQGDISSNDRDAQEVSILSMHLLQSCLVYVNTLMVQDMLAERLWYDRLTVSDWRGITPLFYSHINPYGQFDLDMQTRIPLAQPSAA